ncbi:LacI family transcriptional regulator [Granulosicoccus sp. 3-233]|uniref:LacI family transcriptional regulator n=1 Tax=Granulosicoccus sp. 3-233 TaxID=3417969 RepID=UPI003D337010
MLKDIVNRQHNEPDLPADLSTRPTLKTISRLSGFAVPTVSRALKGAPDISQKTKETVRRIADEIGYVPNRAGVRLSTGKTNVVSLVISTEHDVMNHTARLISGVASELRDTRYHLNVTPWFSGNDAMHSVRYIVESGSADAIILNATTPRDPRVAYLMEKRFPFATHGRTDWSDSHAWFDFDNTAFGRIGISQLAARGRSNIFAILPPADQFYSRCMADGARQAALETGVTLTICDKINSDRPALEIRNRFAEVLAEDPTIDGIFADSPVASLTALDAVKSAPSRSGRKIEIFGKELMPFVSLFHEEFLSMPEDVRRAGRFLARAVLQAIEEPERPPMQELEVPADRWNSQTTA